MFASSFCFLLYEGGITFTHILDMCLYEFLTLVESLFHGNQAMIRKLASFFSKANRLSYNFLKMQERNKDIIIYYEINTS